MMASVERSPHRAFASWQDIDRPKQLFLDTPLAEGGVACAAVVAPDRPAYRAQAEKIVAAVRRASGVQLPLYSDSRLDPLRPPPSHLILLGNLNDNRLIPPLYAGLYVVADALYPGAGGHDLRTVHDPWGSGRNAILVGGSDAAGVAESCGRLIGTLRCRGDATYLPPLLDVAPGPALLERLLDLAIDPDEPYLEQEMARARHMLETSAHGGITEPLARAGLLYHLTGKLGWAEAFKRLAFLMYDDFLGGREQFGGPWGMDADFRLHKIMPAWDLAWIIHEGLRRETA
jgi:hypothetical protein